MSHFTAATVPTSPLDPYKRVNYTLGMILGKDDFEQEQTYFKERDRLQNRLLHGYGTAFGLDVTAASDGSVAVSPGIAVDQLGREIRVPQEQCGNVKIWLAANLPPMPMETARPRASKKKPEISPSASVYVVLKYRECQSDLAPLPEGACCSEDANLAPSRITETFDLIFSLTAPAQAEEESVRTFGDLLSRIRIVPSPGSATIDQLVQILSAGAGEGGPGDLLIGADEAKGMLEELFRVWVTDVRPAIDQPGADAAVLLARLDLYDNSGEILVVESHRPYLLHTRLLQEYLLRRPPVDHHHLLLGLELDDHKHYLLVNPADRSLIANLDAAGNKVVNLAQAAAAGEAMPYGQTAAGDLSGTLPGPTVAALQGRAVSSVAPTDKQALTYNAAANEWQPAGPYLQVTLQGALIADLSAASHKITDLPQAGADGEAMPYGQAAGGDLKGSLPNPSVAKLQGFAVAPTPPVNQGVLTWNSATGQWEARLMPPGIQLEQVAGQLPTTHLATINRIPAQPDEGPTYRLWFHIDVGAPDQANVPQLQPQLPTEAIQVFQESGTTTPFPFLTPLAVAAIRPVGRNLFDVMLKAGANPDLLRFVFNLKAMRLTGRAPVTLSDWVQKRPMKWSGHDGGDLVTAFYKEEQPLRSFTVAAGSVIASGGTDRPIYQGLWGNISVDTEQTTGNCILSFPGFWPGGQYVVNGTPSTIGKESSLFMVAQQDDRGIHVRAQMISGPFVGFQVSIIQFEGLPMSVR